MADLLDSFLRAFERAIASEMAAMRDRMGPFEVAIRGGREIPAARSAGADAAPAFAYTFERVGRDDKLVAGSECTLRRPGSEVLVTIEEVGSETITLRTARELRGLGDAATLVIYPWFLYEKLRESLGRLAAGDDYFVESGLRLFGKLAPTRRPCAAKTDLSALNPSQREAVALCLESDLAFVWGPPGTGKTHTLAHIVEAQLAEGRRVLLTSTTNAAVDQALEQIAGLPGLEEATRRGDVLRIGRPTGPTYGAGQSEVVARRTGRVREKLAALRPREADLRERIACTDELLEAIDSIVDAAQGDLFGEPRGPELSPRLVARTFSRGRVALFAALPAADQRRRVEQRGARLRAAQALAKERGSRLARDLQQREAEVVSSSRLVLATMTNAYFSRLLEGERFDTVIVEEAGMAILPTLFYCASLARHQVVMVGDPRQLPPIVQSREPDVQRFMARSIFDVTVPEPHGSPWVALLDTQYRMHPRIGGLVSDLYYEGALQSDASTRERDDIARLAPHPGRAIVVIDTHGATECETASGSFSRVNPETAALCVALAQEAIGAGQASIAIITPYAEQSRAIRSLLRAAGLPRDAVECSTVHRFQGHERDVVILDAVDTAPLRPGVLLASRDDSARKLLNVSLSRARGKLVLIADVAYFAQRAPGSAIDEALRAAVDAGALVGAAGARDDPGMTPAE